MDAGPDYTVQTSHGIAYCETCLRAADWAVAQVKIMGTAVGRDRIMDEHGTLHRASARLKTKEEMT